MLQAIKVVVDWTPCPLLNLNYNILQLEEKSQASLNMMFADEARKFTSISPLEFDE